VPFYTCVDDALRKVLQDSGANPDSSTTVIYSLVKVWITLGGELGSIGVLVMGKRILTVASNDNMEVTALAA